MLRTLLLALLLTVIFAKMATHEHHHSKYKAWKEKHGVTFEESEEKYRMFLFKKKDAEIKAHNAKKQSTFTMGHNQFSCMTFEELSSNYLGAIPPNQEDDLEDEEFSSSDSNNNRASDSSSNEDESSVSVVAPKSHPIVGDESGHPIVKLTEVNWRAAGGITGVRNQGQCGSCWAFSAAAVIESARKIQLGKGGRISEQQLVDCVYDRDGCRGGWMATAFKYVIDNDGLQKEKDYPYTAEKNLSCPRGDIGGPAKIHSYAESVNRDCSSLQQLIAIRPATMAVHANSPFFSYESGVFDGCPPEVQINHAVLVYGYTSQGHWRIKNSWGTGWGMKGHMKLKSGNTCNVCRWGGDNVDAKN